MAWILSPDIGNADFCLANLFFNFPVFVFILFFCLFLGEIFLVGYREIVTHAVPIYDVISC